MTFSIDWTLWGLLIIATTFELGGDLALKWWAETDYWPVFGLGIGAYTVGLVIFAVLLRRAELATIFTLWVGLAIILLTAAGWFLFDETLSMRQLVAIALVVTGVLLLGMERG
jgi:paired small multidrug resistance pump